jgi:hypothetical protein
MTLYPHVVTRIGCGAPAVLLAWPIWQLAAENRASVWLLAAMFAGLVYVSIRGFRMRVICTPETVTICGTITSRTIARSAITSIDADAQTLPRIHWENAAGKSRWSPMMMFSASGRELAFSARSKQRQLAKLQKWYRAGGPTFTSLAA